MWAPGRKKVTRRGQSTETFQEEREEASQKITEERCSRRRALVDETVGRIRIDCRGPSNAKLGNLDFIL